MSTYNNKQPIAPEVGKFYQSRDGRKIRIYATDGSDNYSYPVHGAVLESTGWVFNTWTIDGWLLSGKVERPLDIVSEWIEKPEVDWASMPAWMRFVAKDNSSGAWYCYDQAPFHSKDEGVWTVSGSILALRIPRDFEPKFAGDWKDSLCERPKASSPSLRS